MNRRKYATLFGRSARTTFKLRNAERQRYFRAHLEPLEDRKMLAAVVYYNDDWTVIDSGGNTIPADPADGDTVKHDTDFVVGVSGLIYGDTAFGTGSFGGTGEFPFIGGQSAPSTPPTPTETC